jgi:hypothetical protein
LPPTDLREPTHSLEDALKLTSSALLWTTRVLGIMVIASLFSLATAFAQTQQVPAPTSPQGTQPAFAQDKDAWRATMSRAPPPKAAGCFTSAYPSLEWKEVPCTTPLPRPHPPVRGTRPDNVGKATDFIANATGTISQATGSFDSVSGVTSVTDSATGKTDTFSLQINTNFMDSTKISLCGGAAKPKDCQGWQQFIFDTDGCKDDHGKIFPCIYIQYWLVQYRNTSSPVTCPDGWAPSDTSNCFESSKAVGVPPQTIAGLANMSLEGTAASGGSDYIVLSVGDPPTLHTAVNPDSIFNLAQNWNQAEFNIFGDCCTHTAIFNSGSTLVVRTSVNAGISASCAEGGFTGETNSLNLVETPVFVSDPPGALSAIVFTESNVDPLKPRSCAINTCGHTSQACCNNNVCGGGLTCSGGICTCGGPFEPCCKPGGSCNSGLTCIRPALLCASENSECAKCNQRFKECVSRCDSDRCKCMCGNTEAGCIQEHSCGPFQFQNCSLP